jgi:hypothetical protein
MVIGTNNLEVAGLVGHFGLCETFCDCADRRRSGHWERFRCELVPRRGIQGVPWSEVQQAPVATTSVTSRSEAVMV